MGNILGRRENQRRSPAQRSSAECRPVQLILCIESSVIFIARLLDKLPRNGVFNYLECSQFNIQILPTSPSAPGSACAKVTGMVVGPTLHFNLLGYHFALSNFLGYNLSRLYRVLLPEYVQRCAQSSKSVRLRFQ